MTREQLTELSKTVSRGQFLLSKIAEFQLQLERLSNTDNVVVFRIRDADGDHLEITISDTVAGKIRLTLIDYSKAMLDSATIDLAALGKP